MTTEPSPPPTRGKSVTSRAAAALLAGVGLFQVALAAGAPWGSLSWGGAYPGVLPREIRAASAVAAVIYAGLAAVSAGSLLRGTAGRWTLRAAAALFAVGTIANAASPSWGEKLLWTPVSAALAALTWRTSREG